MPLYDYQCPCGARVEALRPSGTDSLSHACGAEAKRVPSLFAVIGPSDESEGRNRFRRYQEATQEMDHAYSRAEADLERSIPAPDLWGNAKATALAMTAAGEAPSLPRPA